VEAIVFRFNGHFVGDGDGYMPGGKIQLAALSDPIPRLRSLLIEALGVQQSDITELETDCLNRAKAAINSAMEAEPVSGESVLSDVYVE
jgi:pyruvate dehydrogenase E1 component alpha subunit